MTNLDISFIDWIDFLIDQIGYENYKQFSINELKVLYFYETI